MVSATPRLDDRCSTGARSRHTWYTDHEAAWREYGRYLRAGGAHAEQAREVREAKQRIFKFAEEAP